MCRYLAMVGLSLIAQGCTKKPESLSADVLSR